MGEHEGFIPTPEGQDPLPPGPTGWGWGWRSSWSPREGQQVRDGLTLHAPNLAGPGGSLRRGGKGMLAGVQSHRESPQSTGSSPQGWVRPTPPPSSVLTVPGLCCLPKGGKPGPSSHPGEHHQQRQGSRYLCHRHMLPLHPLRFGLPSH